MQFYVMTTCIRQFTLVHVAKCHSTISWKMSSYFPLTSFKASTGDNQHNYAPTRWGCTAVNKTTGVEPCLLTFARRLRTPLQILKDNFNVRFTCDVVWYTAVVTLAWCLESMFNRQCHLLLIRRIYSWSCKRPDVTVMSALVNAGLLCLHGKRDGKNARNHLLQKR